MRRIKMFRRNKNKLTRDEKIDFIATAIGLNYDGLQSDETFISTRDMIARKIVDNIDTKEIARLYKYYRKIRG